MKQSSAYRFLIIVLMIGLLIPTQIGCSSRVTNQYALCMSHLSNSFTNILADAARTKASELGIDLTILDAQNSVARQANQIETLISDGVAGIIIEPAAEKGLESAIKSCEEHNIPVVLVTQNLDDESTVDCFVGPDSRLSGQLQMQACVDTLAGQGRIVILHGPMGSDAQQSRYLGYQDILQTHPAIRIVAELNADWSETRAEQIIANWLSSGKIFDAVVAQNDEMALGSIKALKAAGQLENVKVFGIDASPAALDAIASGELTATLSQQTDVQGVKAVEAIVAIANHQPVQTDKFVEQFLIQSIHSID